jgi:phosphoribosylformimino-5-aminoimidazole carboxamide ribotide isomerase
VILFPAIDIRGGAAVRLLQGDYERETAYDADPVDAALRWSNEGAEYLHVVDLDGARSGKPVNLDVIERIVAAVPCPVEAGGGLRDADSVAAVLRAGAECAVIGTAALRDPEFLDEMVAHHGDRIVVSVDARGGNVALAGWTEASEKSAVDAVAELTGRGARRFLCTTIEVDGTMEGPAIEELKLIAAATDAEVLASGGVGTVADLEALAGAMPPNVAGVIVGRALYEGRFTVAEANAALGRG